jgi:D-alanine transaminase/branched-chain amino acid aminotransferase
MKKWAFVNEQYVAEEKASLHFRDLSIQRGYGVFDFLKLIDNTPLFLEDHLDRFSHSAHEMFLPVRHTKEELSSLIQELVRRNNLPASGIRLTLTGGYSPDGYRIGEPNFILSQDAIRYPTLDQFRAGIRLITHEYRRPLPHVKTIDYLMAVWLQPLICRSDADDVLYHSNGLVTECPRSNFFIVTKDETIVTAEQHILKGIARKKLLEIAKKKFQVEEKMLKLEDVFQAKEAFVTSTTKAVLPVVSVAGRPIGKGVPGPVSKDLFHLLQIQAQQNVLQYR